MAASQILTGAKVALFINGQIYGRVNSFSFTVSTIRNEIYGIDNIEPYEEALTRVQVSATIGVYKLLSDGGASGIGLSTPVPDLPQAKYSSIALIEIPTQNTIFQVNKASLETESWNFVTKSIVQGTFSLKALSYTNEVPPA